jgi:molybdopterin converting factor small subunit
MLRMRIRLLAFASAADALGRDETTIEVAAGASVRDLVALIGERYPSLLALLPQTAVAVDGEVVATATLLHDDAEVALLPPVSGG